MGFDQKFRAKNKKLAAGTVKTYLSQIKRLARFAGYDSIPATGKWLTKKNVFSEVKRLPVSTRKNLATAAVKAAAVYGRKIAMYENMMRKATGAYEEQRNKREKSTKEKLLWFDYKKLFVAGKRLWADVKQDADKWTFPDFRKAQKAILLLVYGLHTPRLLESLVRPGHKGSNQLLKGKRFRIVLTDYKTAKARGPSKFTLDKKLDEPLTRFLKAGERLLDHAFVFAGAKKQPLSKPGFSKLVTSACRAGGLPGATVQIIRVLKASDPDTKAVMDKAAALQQEFGHGQKQAKQYSKK